jgi:hypothetical protein
MKKFIGFSLALTVGIFAVNRMASAEGAKTAIAFINTTNVVAASTAAPAALYSVILGTCAVGDYVAFFDSGSASGLSAALASSTAKFKVFYSSSTANLYGTQVVNFSPPIQFRKGLMAVPSGVTAQGAIVYEQGIASGD